MKASIFSKNYVAFIKNHQGNPSEMKVSALEPTAVYTKKPFSKIHLKMSKEEARQKMQPLVRVRVLG